MFFVKDLKTGKVEAFKTPRETELFLIGKSASQHEVYFSPAPVDLSGGKHFCIERTLKEVQDEDSNRRRVA